MFPTYPDNNNKPLNTNRIQPPTKKWYDDTAKLALSLLCWPLFIYGFYKTELMRKDIKAITFICFVGLCLFSIIAGRALKIDGIGVSSPSGKSWLSVGFGTANASAWTEIDFGNSPLGGSNFFNYSKQFFDGFGNPLRAVHRTGTFSVEGNTIHCNFSDGKPPYEMKYQNSNGNWYVIDEYNNTAFYWDDPAKRKL